jgi:hypothetical protein
MRLAVLISGLIVGLASCGNGTSRSIDAGGAADVRGSSGGSVGAGGSGGHGGTGASGGGAGVTGAGGAGAGGTIAGPGGGGKGGASGGAGGSADSAGQTCGGPARLACSGNTFCDYDVGVCDSDPKASGVCVKKEYGVCVNADEFVCGCDGETYENECSRVAAGVSKRSDGVCTGAGGTGGARSDAGTSIRCGTGFCSAGQYCCNSLMNGGGCAPIGGACVQSSSM